MPTSTTAADKTATRTADTKRQSLLFTKVVFPECPPKPVKPKSPHPKWIVLALKKPECVRNDSGDLVWVFFSFYHITTYETRWIPPPRPQEETLIKSDYEQSEEEEEEGDKNPEVIDVDADPNTKTQKGILLLIILYVILYLHLVCLLHKIRIIRLAIKHMLLLRPRNVFIQCSSALI